MRNDGKQGGFKRTNYVFPKREWTGLVAQQKFAPLNASLKNEGGRSITSIPWFQIGGHTIDTRSLPLKTKSNILIVSYDNYAESVDPVNESGVFKDQKEGDLKAASDILRDEDGNIQLDDQGRTQYIVPTRRTIKAKIFIPEDTGPLNLAGTAYEGLNIITEKEGPGGKISFEEELVVSENWHWRNN